MSQPDFAALRAERDAAVQRQMQVMADEWGVPLQGLLTSHDTRRCYCACTTGGPCEHDWDGEPYEADGLWTRTCSKCGTTSFSHSMHTAP